MILIYTHHINSRVTYVMDLVFGNVLHTAYTLTDNQKEFEESAFPKIAYTSSFESAAVFIKSNKLLFETQILSVFPDADKDYTDFPKFFKSGTSDFLGYDLFAMVFYFASRYEEYIDNKKDPHQRFQAENSIAFQYNCLQIPFLNYAIDAFSIKLQQKFPDLIFSKRAFRFLSTIDIDNAYAYAHKGFGRNIGGFLKDAASVRLKDVITRIASNLNDQKDPYNTFELINRLSYESQTALQYFVLIGDYGEFDKNPHHHNKEFRRLLKNLSDKHVMGLHPSYTSYNNPEKIGIEKKRLEDIIDKKVTSARCHFLRVNLPETYRTFVDNGITDDYTMIYASQSGFRTGLCTPYQWFDLEKNEATPLTIHTSVIMEGTLRDYNKLTTEDATQLTLRLLQEVKKYGGEFISIFHNDSFVPAQKEWIEFYKTILKNN
ncbi:MAG: polysaccharide deacetylase family protein [Bacteroidetes bacterium]|nr:polysaccharide deacetylase family protein [Bacteroidota bacterium]